MITRIRHSSGQLWSQNLAAAWPRRLRLTAFAASILNVAALFNFGCAPARAQAAADAVASPWQTVQSARVRLIGGGSFAGGPQRAAGVEMTLDRDWKTYWRMPGEAGVPPQFDFQKSDNVAKVEVLYPAPQRFRDPGGDAVGYKTRVVFPLRVTPLDASKPVALIGELAFGVCKDICVPVETTLKLDLQPSQAGPIAPVAEAADLVPRGKSSLRKADPVITSIEGALVAGQRRLMVSVKVPEAAHASADLFIEAPEGLFVPMAQKTASKDGQVLFTIDFSKLADAKDLLGKELRLTAVTAHGASEALWTAR